MHAQANDIRGVWAVVLAGGEGVRLRRFLRDVIGARRPKQFCRIVGRRTMLRHTWDRAARLVPPDRIVTAITAGQESHVEYEARAGVPGTILVQPENKDTGPGLLLPLLWIARRDPMATVAVFPADHFVWEEDRFVDHVLSALAAAQAWPDRLILLGVEADGPEVEYGWIAPAEPVAGGGPAELYGVRRFWEKPDRRTAAHLLACGYLWNTLVLAGHVGTFLGLAAATIPHVLEMLRAAAGCLDAPADLRSLAESYGRVPSTNISRAVLARCPERLLVLAARGLTWSDWGDPDRIVRSLRRFGRRPSWLAAYARAQVAAGA
jgi:mannose-1-phosphate guanylyltransferase